MTDYLNPHKMGSDYPVVNRAGEIQTGRVDVAPGFESERDTATDGKPHPDNGVPIVKESLITDEEQPTEDIPKRYSSGMPHEQEDAFFDDRVVIKLVEGAYALVSKTDGKYGVALGRLKPISPPLDENGLARCGCGGKAKLVVQIESNYFVRCEKCGFRSGVLVGWEPAKTDTIKAWNRAMGVKEADE